MLMVYLPLVIARWIHFACVFVLFGSSFFWLYEGHERYPLALADCRERFARQLFCCASPHLSQRFQALPGSRWF